jgi:hypothetical protein
MTPKEEYDLKRKYFIDNTKKYFKFLVDDFQYSEPKYRSAEQKNGTIISDEFTYESESIDRIITVTNAYHPYDYGFEICFYRPSISMAHSLRKMAIPVLKENQDIEQSYIEPIAKKFKNQFLEVIKGEKWIE